VLVGTIEDGDEQLTAAGEGLVEVAIAQAGGAADVLDAGGGVATGAVLLKAGVEQALAPLGNALLGVDAAVPACGVARLGGLRSDLTILIVRPIILLKNGIVSCS
jgi:hypothetical protein